MERGYSGESNHSSRPKFLAMRPLRSNLFVFCFPRQTIEMKMPPPRTAVRMDEMHHLKGLYQRQQRMSSRSRTGVRSDSKPGATRDVPHARGHIT